MGRITLHTLWNIFYFIPPINVDIKGKINLNFHAGNQHLEESFKLINLDLSTFYAGKSRLILV